MRSMPRTFIRVCFEYVRRNACNMHVYISIYPYPYIRVSVYVRMYICIYVDTHMCIYAHRHSSDPARRQRDIDTPALVSGRFLDD